MKYYKALFTVTVCSDVEPAVTEQLRQTANDVVCALAADAGFEAFEEQDGGVCGYVQQQNYNAEALDSALKSFPIAGVQVGYTITEAADQNWNAEWERTGFQPIVIGSQCVVHDTVHTGIAIPDGAMNITIDTHQAFGTGSHDTTRMIIAELLSRNLSGQAVLDCGCGTGILSIVAAKHGAKTVCAYDIDSWSASNTRHNCALNGVHNVQVALGDSSVIAMFNRSFNAVLANINRNILLADMPRMCAAMQPGALLILSGFYTDDAPMLCDRAEALHLRCVKQAESNKWCMLVMQKE